VLNVLSFVACRTGEETLDGCAIFVRNNNFRIISHHAIEYKISDDHPILNRDNIALLLVVEWTQVPKKASIATPIRFILANTHLLFNPGVRTIYESYSLSTEF
jgi:protein angel